ncbi:unnamed protein product [Gongylonema pulchrum]|uniref:Pecanex-like protein n=1 Tax=Gongylonema pulchrum TaxID=637853 RepID=A0A183CWX5_9BILA|nr:unnamed protein product [Gongylonema pulchrum]
MIASYVDSAIQHHYNRCSSPECQKYASKPELMSLPVRSGSDASDDEWIRCVDDVTLEESFTSDCGRKRTEAELTTAVLIAQHSKSAHTAIMPDKHMQNIHSGTNGVTVYAEEIAEDGTEKVENPVDFSAVFEPTTTNFRTGEMKEKEEQHPCLEKTVCTRNDGFVSRRAYSLEDLDNVPGIVTHSPKKLQIFKSKIINVPGDRHFVEISNLPDSKHNAVFYETDCKQVTEGCELKECYETWLDKGSAHSGQFEPVHSSRLPGYYGFAFDARDLNSPAKTQLESVGSNTALSVIGKYKFETEQIKEPPCSTVALWDDCCEYAQRISEVARIWLRNPTDSSEVQEIMASQVLTTCLNDEDREKPAGIPDSERSSVSGMHYSYSRILIV